MKEKTQIEETCETIEKMGTATVAEFEAALGDHAGTSAKNRIRKAMLKGWLAMAGDGKPKRYAVAAAWRDRRACLEKVRTLRELEGVMAYKTWVERAAAVIDALGVGGSAEIANALDVTTGNASNMVARAAECGWLKLEIKTAPRKYSTTPAWADHALSVRAAASGDRLAAYEVAPMPTGGFAGTWFYGLDRPVTSWSRA